MAASEDASAEIKLSKWANAFRLVLLVQLSFAKPKTVCKKKKMSEKEQNG